MTIPCEMNHSLNVFKIPSLNDLLDDNPEFGRCEAGAERC